MGTYTFYADPGHSWLAVPIVDLDDVGLTRADFSVFSYVKNEIAYLEEDCDAFVFVNAYVEKYGVRPKFKENYHESNGLIRNYKRLNGNSGK